MSMLDAAMDDFGTLLGLDAAVFSGREHLAVEIEGAGELHVERRDEALLVYLSRPLEVGVDKLQVYKSALRRVHFENGLDVRVQCGLHGEHLVFLARYDGDELTMQALEHAIEVLINLHDSVMI